MAISGKSYWKQPNNTHLGKVSCQREVKLGSSLGLWTSKETFGTSVCVGDGELPLLPSSDGLRFPPLQTSAFSLSRFFSFILRFWNQIFTCVSFSFNWLAISKRRARVRYLFVWNSFSSSVNCFVLKFVRFVPAASSKWETRDDTYVAATGTDFDFTETHCVHSTKVHRELNVFDFLKLRFHMDRFLSRSSSKICA